jgi:hypothetical protein
MVSGRPLAAVHSILRAAAGAIQRAADVVGGEPALLQKSRLPGPLAQIRRRARPEAPPARPCRTLGPSLDEFRQGLARHSVIDAALAQPRLDVARPEAPVRARVRVGLGETGIRLQPGPGQIIQDLGDRFPGKPPRLELGRQLGTPVLAPSQ